MAQYRLTSVLINLCHDGIQFLVRQVLAKFDQDSAQLRSRGRTVTVGIERLEGLPKLILLLRHLLHHGYESVVVSIVRGKRNIE